MCLYLYVEKSEIIPHYLNKKDHLIDDVWCLCNGQTFTKYIIYVPRQHCSSFSYRNRTAMRLPNRLNSNTRLYKNVFVVGNNIILLLLKEQILY